MGVEPGPEPFWTVDGLAAGEGRALDDRSGWAVAIVADAGGAVAEADETNNRYVVPTLVPLTPPPTCSPTPTPTMAAPLLYLPRAER